VSRRPPTLYLVLEGISIDKTPIFDRIDFSNHLYLFLFFLFWNEVSGKLSCMIRGWRFY
jgi:hypothetical protein